IELRTLQDRVQQARRENKHLRKELHSLQLQVAALSGQEALATRPGALAQSAAAPAKRTIVRKKPVSATPADQ
ncbi:MAG: class III poly(R)-hydroxyalkanoic acid synthase subunit PhaE, partial [Chromatiaceae bacterium]|nr:class III poly(R)-hydroxyalkanoic acid synthase subunit PhaE [Candidatus Thioaporhodococcus sediminis]